MEVHLHQPVKTLLGHLIKEPAKGDACVVEQNRGAAMSL